MEAKNSERASLTAPWKGKQDVTSKEESKDFYKDFLTKKKSTKKLDQAPDKEVPFKAHDRQNGDHTHLVSQVFNIKLSRNQTSKTQTGPNSFLKRKPLEDETPDVKVNNFSITQRHGDASNLKTFGARSPDFDIQPSALTDHQKLPQKQKRVGNYDRQLTELDGDKEIGRGAADNKVVMPHKVNIGDKTQRYSGRNKDNFIS